MSEDNAAHREVVAERVVVQISDTHITSGGLLHDLVDSLDNLDRVLSAVEDAGAPPDLLLFTGDLADKGESEAYKRFRDLVEPYVERLSVPVMYVPGNHDMRAPFREHLLGWDAIDESVDQVVEVNGLRVISLDSTVPGSAHGDLRPAQLAWLAEQISDPAEHGTVLALHHPPIPGPSRFLNQLTLRQPQALAEVVRGSDVSMIVTGHAHHVSAGALGGVPVWVATATAYQMDVLASATHSMRGLIGSGFTRIDVFADTVVATLVPVIESQRYVYDVDFATIQRFLDHGATAEDVEAAFSQSPGVVPAEPTVHATASQSSAQSSAQSVAPSPSKV